MSVLTQQGWHWRQVPPPSTQFRWRIRELTPGKQMWQGSQSLKRNSWAKWTMDTPDFPMCPLPYIYHTLCESPGKITEAWEGIRISVLRGRKLELRALCSCVTLSKPLPCSGPQFPHMEMGGWTRGLLTPGCVRSQEKGRPMTSFLVAEEEAWWEHVILGVLGFSGRPACLVGWAQSTTSLQPSFISHASLHRIPPNILLFQDALGLACKYFLYVQKGGGTELVWPNSLSPEKSCSPQQGGLRNAVWRSWVSTCFHAHQGKKKNNL